ncbi:MAG: nucleotidyltransferase domain-containing protein [Candidatus Stygibacter frigidus]|nr:nucleotidyltransferase domain-containing protein [Candidatus Stygibacter frigidus]
MTDQVSKYRNSEELKRICLDAGITYLAIFGSQARGEENLDSDIDLLYKLKPGITYFEFYDIIEQLRDFFKKEIDAVPVEYLRESFIEAIASEVEVLYEKTG